LGNKIRKKDGPRHGAWCESNFWGTFMDERDASQLPRSQSLTQRGRKRYRGPTMERNDAWDGGKPK